MLDTNDRIVKVIEDRGDLSLTDYYNHQCIDFNLNLFELIKPTYEESMNYTTVQVSLTLCFRSELF
jgi:hypothetical protein